MTKTQKTYYCWRSSCKTKSFKGRLKEEDLIKRNEDKDHIDFCCPECESVIICTHKGRHHC